MEIAPAFNEHSMDGRPEKELLREHAQLEGPRRTADTREPLDHLHFIGGEAESGEQPCGRHLAVAFQAPSVLDLDDGAAVETAVELRRRARRTLWDEMARHAGPRQFARGQV